MKTAWHCWRCREEGVVEHRVDHRPEVVRRKILAQHHGGISCGGTWKDISTNRDVVRP